MRDIEVVKTLATLYEDDEDLEGTDAFYSEEVAEDSAATAWYEEYGVYRFFSGLKSRMFGGDR